MNPPTFHSKLCCAVLTLGSGAVAAPASLPLQPGTYVVSSYKPCEQAPLAGVKAFDGKTFKGVHEANCATSVLSHRGRTYHVSTQCRSHGDGTPEAPTMSLQTVEVKSTSTLAVINHGEKLDYELCPKFH